ncbi:MAG: 3-isopropylmalate dehydratase [Gammaproteobacteria bacterium]|nr:3-isopropylmalate dehydratase [Gammaproteobacteria bacterium]NIM71656.1 3-isopropylmalate dehydratase [Gammaproteobacteria bacterium]NIO23400.1 3-isopropylmalate dehydratase [Gammaproteobacteria bacterium]NIO64021.1 3-isopropylmalate dehydratase [Gammaproteobacteria bacterium]NIP46130.1 3-isopropylmalate dehydratase [Gammaproteobacteria bacterium]
MSESGRAWVYGDGINTDLLAPAAYLKGSMEELAAHCLQDLDPDFARSVKEGDVFVAGDNLGIGSSREQAPQALQMLGIRTVLAKSFGRIFYRNALNLGMPALVCADTDRIRSGDRLRVDATAGVVENLTSGETLACESLPPHLVEMVADGGLIPHLKKKLAGGR